jgi:cytoskeletal protein CcmA (bactofilin family)/DNA-directed RNA polymerase subunit RPC12/RpoP
MSKKKSTTQQVTCPHCGYQQFEPVGGVSTTCRHCGKYFSLEVVVPKKRKEALVRQEREIQCDLCGHHQYTPLGTLSTFCEKCGAYMNVRNYDISGISREKVETYGDAIFNTGCNYRGTHVIAYRVTVRGYVYAWITAKKELLIEEGGKVRGSLTTLFLRVLKGGLARSSRIEAKILEVEGEIEVDECIAQEVRVGKHGHLKARHLIAETLQVVSGGTLTGEFSTLNMTKDFPSQSSSKPSDDLLSMMEE